MDLVEKAHKLLIFDTEALGLRGDYSSMLVFSGKPYGKKPVSFAVKKPGDDKQLVKDAGDFLESFSCWVTYFGKGYDIKMLNTRRLRHGLAPVAKRPHIDLYFSLKSNLLTARKSQGHLLSWLQTPQSKMSVSATAWAELAADPGKYMPTMIARCESDTRGLEALYKRCRHLIVDITR